LASYVMHGEDVNKLVSRYRNITVDDVARVASYIFDEKRCSTLIYRQQNKD